MTGTQDKIRSLFLVAIMVLSVFGGTIAFSGSVAAASNVSYTSTPSSVINSDAVHTWDVSYTSDDSDATDENVTVTIDQGEFDTDDSFPGWTVTYTNNNQTANFTVSESVTSFSFDASIHVDQDEDVTVTTYVNESDAGAPTGSVADTVTVTPDITADQADDRAVSESAGDNRFWYGQQLLLENGNPGAVYEIHRVTGQDDDDTQFISDITIDADGQGLARTARVDHNNLNPTERYVIVDETGELQTIDSNGQMTDATTQVEVATDDELRNAGLEITMQDLEVTFNRTEFTVGDNVGIEIESRRGTGYWVLVESPNDNFTSAELETLFANYGATSAPSTAPAEGDMIAPVDSDIAAGDHDALFFVDSEFDDEAANTNLGIGANSTTDNLQYNVVDTGFAEGTEATDEGQITVNPVGVSNIELSGAEFDQGSYTEQTGDVAEVTVDFTEDYSDYSDGTIFRTYVMVGSAGDRIIDLVNITDVDQDGSATFAMNTFELGREDPTAVGATSPNDAYTNISADNINVTRPRHFGNVPSASAIAGADGDELVWGHETGSSDTPDFDTPSRSGINNPLGATSYSMQSMSAPVINLSADENNMVLPAFSDAASLVLEERSLQENVNVWVGPQGSDSSMVNRSTILSEVTQVNANGSIESDTVANGDVVVLQFQASGLEGHVSGMDDILGPNGIHTFVAQSNVPADGDRYYWDLDQSSVDLIADSENDTYFVVVPTSRLTGVGTLDNAPPRNTMYEANMVIAGGQTLNRSDVGATWTNATSGTFADFYEEGEFPDDNNFADTYNNDDFEWNLDTYDFVWHPQPWFTQQEQERADTSVNLRPRVADFDQYVENVSELRLSANAEELVSGETNLAPGSSFRVSVQNTSAAFNRNVDVTVRLEDGQRVWNTTLDLEGEAGTPFLAQVLEAGVSITTSAQATISTAQGDAVPGLVTERPMASVTMDDQTARDAGTLVTVHDVSMNKGGFVAIHSGDASGPVVGVSRYLNAGNHSNVNVRLEESVTGTATLVAMPHIDTNDNHVYDWVANSNLDGPFVENGTVVTDSASVQIPTPTPTPTTETPTPTTETPTPTTETPTPTTETPTPTTETPEPATATPTEGDGPGFGIIVALVALVAAALLAVRRER